MGQVKIVTDTTCDLPQDIIQKYDIRLVPISISLGDSTYKEMLELQPEQFYDYLSSSPQRPTSAAAASARGKVEEPSRSAGSTPMATTRHST